MNTPGNSEVQSSPSGEPGRQAVILAGGLGTRLRSVLPDTPKCMALVAGKPFVSYVIEHLKKQGVDKFIFSLGYMGDVITRYLNDRYPMLDIQYSMEEDPLGTGGAIKHACKLATEKNLLVLNGDTFFSLSITKLLSFHNLNEADCTLSLKPMQNFDRYGVVEMDTDHSITSFKEKHHYDNGLINAGVYALNAAKFIKEALPEKFSFENDYLEKYFAKRKVYGLVQDGYFIDIGVPEDYARAQEELEVKSR